MEKLKRYIIFIIGLYINSFGVSLITKAALGTSPISSIPYVLSLNFPFTLGQFTIFFSILLIVLQLFILGKNFKLEHALQIPVSIAFGYFIDFSMFLLADLMPQAYVWKMIYLLLGCLILGIGVYAEVLADVVMLPGESFVRAIVFRWNTDFGITKICFDVSMAVIAVALSFVFAGKQRRAGGNHYCGHPGGLYCTAHRKKAVIFTGKIVSCKGNRRRCVGSERCWRWALYSDRKAVWKRWTCYRKEAGGAAGICIL